MSERENDQNVQEFDIPEMDEEPTVGEPAEDDADLTERIAEIQGLARAGELEAPAGAEEIVAALTAALAERDEQFAKLQRAVADHQNFQRRAGINEREARTQALTGVVQSIIPVLDNFELALGQDLEKATAQQIAGGVTVIRDELLRVLSTYGVTKIDPQVGDEFDPMEHEAMLQQPAEGVGPGRIAAALGVGYKLGERVVRPAKVAVVPGESS
ncbi:MAG: nucleotide exchange factor GrpE [Phycisphaerales bacterium]